MTRFDGVALLGLDPSTEVARRRDAAAVRQQADGRLVRLPDGALARGTRPIGLPATLRCDPGAACTEVVVLGLTEAAGRPGTGAAHPWDRAFGRAITALAVLPPVRIDDLIAVEPLPGGRVHAAHWGADTVACGRLPVHGATHPPTAIDCERCLSRGLLGERITAQVATSSGLAALAGPLTAAAAARWWWRLDHLDTRSFPAVLDSAVGAVVHALPGAPDPDTLLGRLAEDSDHLSDAARAWAVTVARRRASGGDGDAVRLLARLLPPPEAGELLLDVLDEHRGDRALEALLWEVAVRAGPAGSPRLQRWRRIQAVAAALAS